MFGVREPWMPAPIKAARSEAAGRVAKKAASVSAGEGVRCAPMLTARRVNFAGPKRAAPEALLFSCRSR
jgi:hypothetical protein